MSSLRPERIGRPSLTLATAAGIAGAAGILAAHAGLLPEAHWQGDDFICAAYARDGHLRYLWEARIGGWSPRPLSETIFYAYGRIAAATRRPFTIPFLASLWTLVLASTLLTMRRGAFAIRVLIGLATTCMFLLGHPIAEMYFWPAGAVAYLTTLATTSLALFLLVDRRTETLSGTIALSTALTACAASSEAGAFATIPLALCLAATLRRGVAILLIPPLLSAGFVLWILSHHRMVSAEAAQHAAPFHHIAASLRPVPRALLDDVTPAWPARLLFALGLRWSWHLTKQTNRPAPTATFATATSPTVAAPALAAFAVSLLLAASATIAAGYFQFATLCCERHDTLRQGWIILAIAALAIASTRWPPLSRTSRLGPATLLAALLLATLPHGTQIIRDYRLMHTITATNRANWRAGRSPSTSMTFRLPQPAALAGAIGIPTGHYSEPALNSWTAHGILHFFGKQTINIQPP